MPLVAAAAVLGVLWRRDVIRPGSFARRGVRDASALPWWRLTLSALVVVLSTAIGGTAAMSVWAVAQGDGTLDGRWADAARADPALSAVATLSGFALGGAVGVWLARRFRALAPGAGLDPAPTWRGVALGLGCFALALPVVMAVNRLAARVFTLLTDVQPEAVSHDTLRAIVDDPGSPWTWGLIAAVVVGAPVAEELAFRGFLQTGVLRATGRAWPAILISSAVFTLVHGLAPYAMATIFVLSVCLGVAYERTRSLAVPIVMHAAFNAGNVLLAVALHR
jgi:membrane protease YdiL (CAAX protease family)